MFKHVWKWGGLAAALLMLPMSCRKKDRPPGPYDHLAGAWRLEGYSQENEHLGMGGYSQYKTADRNFYSRDSWVTKGFVYYYDSVKRQILPRYFLYKEKFEYDIQGRILGHDTLLISERYTAWDSTGQLRRWGKKIKIYPGMQRSMDESISLEDSVIYYSYRYPSSIGSGGGTRVSISRMLVKLRGY